MTTRGGRIPPDGRPPQAKGVGKTARRHDLERPKTPGYHGSDLQKGDVQALEQGQRIAPATVQQPGSPQVLNSTNRNRISSSQGVQAPPDPIDFLAQRNGADFGLPQRGRQIDNHRALNWLPIVKDLVLSPGSSGLLASAFINQARELNRVGATPATIINLGAVDAGMQAAIEGR